MTARWPVIAAGAVVLSAIAATAHGLYEVAVGCRVPPGIAWLYPVITDGLALVAYAATTRLRGPGQAYAWAVVVLGAGLSGLGQATYLAGFESAPTGLRFGVGAWPAIAGAIAAHLLYLLGRTDETPTAAPIPGSVGVYAPSPVVAAVTPAPSKPKRTMVAATPDKNSAETLARALVAENPGIGRRALMTATGLKEYDARKLLEQERAEAPRNGHRVLEESK